MPSIHSCGSDGPIEFPYRNTFQEWFGPTANHPDGMGAVWEQQAKTPKKGIFGIVAIQIERLKGQNCRNAPSSNLGPGITLMPKLPCHSSLQMQAQIAFSTTPTVLPWCLTAPGSNCEAATRLNSARKSISKPCSRRWLITLPDQFPRHGTPGGCLPDQVAGTGLIRRRADRSGDHPHIPCHR